MKLYKLELVHCFYMNMGRSAKDYGWAGRGSCNATVDARPGVCGFLSEGALARWSLKQTYFLQQEQENISFLVLQHPDDNLAV